MERWNQFSLDAAAAATAAAASAAIANGDNKKHAGGAEGGSKLNGSKNTTTTNNANKGRLGQNDQTLEDFCIQYLYPFTVIEDARGKLDNFKPEFDHTDIFAKKSKTMMKNMHGEVVTVPNSPPTSPQTHQGRRSPQASPDRRRRGGKQTDLDPVKNIPMRCLKELKAGLMVSVVVHHLFEPYVYMS